MSNIIWSRRQLFGAATAALAARVGGSLLGNAQLSPLAAALQRSLLMGESRAFADAVAAAGVIGAVDAPIVEVNMSAKLDFNTLLFRPNAAGAGLTGNAMYAASAAFPALGLSRFFGDYLLPAQSSMSLALVPAAKGSAAALGNHDYVPEKTDMTTTGSLAYAINQSTNALLNLDYSTEATVDTGTAIFGVGGGELTSYTSVASSITSLSAAANPMRPLPASSAAAQTALNGLITKDTAFSQQLADLGKQLQTATAGLATTTSLINTKPPTLTAADVLNATAVKANNPLLLQLAVADVAWKSGLTRAVTMTVGSKDVNAGGDFTVAGNTNTDRPGVSAAVAKAMLGQFLVQFNQMYPKGYVIVKGEGGRNNDGGDNPYSLCLIMGPAGAFTTGFMAQSSYTDSAMFSNPSASAALSNGTTAMVTQAIVCATVAKMAGHTFGTYPYLTDLVKPT